MKKYYIEVLRVLATLAVVLLHMKTFEMVLAILTAVCFVIPSQRTRCPDDNYFDGHSIGFVNNRNPDIKEVAYYS